MTRNTIALSLAIASVVTLAFASEAPACDCAAPGPPCNAVPTAAAVFVGRADTVTHEDVRFSIERHVRGTATAPSITIAQTLSMCRYPFMPGERYVVYAFRNEAGVLQTSICTGTKPLDRASNDLAYFDELLRPPTGARVSGRIRHVERDFETGIGVDYGPVVGRSVTLSGSESSIAAVTDRDGRFEFRNLPVGSYEVHVSVPERFAPWRPWPIRLEHDRACAESDSVIQFNGRVIGQLLDQNGRPEGSVQLEIAAASSRGGRSGPFVRSATTSPDGRFEFGPLPPGDYVLGTALSSPPEPNRPDRRRYFSSGPRQDGTIHLDAGSSIELKPFQFPGPAAERVIEGTVQWSDGTLAAGATVELYGAGSQPHVTLNGRFRFTLPYGARFSLAASIDTTRNGARVRASSIDRVFIGPEDSDRTVILRLAVP